MKETSLNSVTKTCIKLLLKEPFFGHYMSGMPKEMTEEVATAGVSLFNKQLVKLEVNPHFWERLSEEHRYGLIKHEVLHIVLKHLLTFRDYSNKQLFNIAADLVVNQYIEPHQLPPNGVTLKRFFYIENRFGIRLEPHKDVGYYYRKLDSILKKSSKDNSEKKRNQGDDEIANSFFYNLLEGKSEELERHEKWNELGKMSAGDATVLEHHLNSLLKTTRSRVERSTQAFGTMPAGLVAQLQSMIQTPQPQFNWRRVLRLFAANSSGTYIQNTLRRPSKRYGTTPGIRLRKKHKLLVAVDTSGSVQVKELDFFF